MMARRVFSSTKPESVSLLLLLLAVVQVFDSSWKIFVGAQYTGEMVKMCLFYPTPSGHARSDPIISQTCPADHIHTFYGPQNFHPNTSFENLRDTGGQYSTTPVIENQSLYWHPSIYEVTTNGNGQKTYTRVTQLESSPYYRWDNSVLPRTEAFPPGFRMIAYSDTQDGVFVECCDYDEEGEESCIDTEGDLIFPTRACDFVSIAFAMPTCWNGDLGIDNDHISHMAYTVDGTVAGACPPGFDRRVPQIQLFVRIAQYKGGVYTTSDESKAFHVDFMNGWQDGKLQQIIDDCPVVGNGNEGYNPPCNCEEFMTENENVGGIVCDNDVKRYILNEETEVISSLPRGTCQGPLVVDKSWAVDPPFTCEDVVAPTPPTPPTEPTPTASPVAPVFRTNAPSQISPAPAPTPTRPTRPRATNFPSMYPTDDEEGDDEEDDDESYYSCADSTVRFNVLWNGRRIARDCIWVSNKATRQRCQVDGVAGMCPETCEICDECIDSTLRFRVVWNMRKISRDCKWVGNKATAQRCRLVGVSEACRETCGLC